MPKGETNEIGQPMINGGSFRGKMEMTIRKEKKRALWEFVSRDGKKEVELLLAGEKWTKATKKKKRLESMEKLVVKDPEETDQKREQ